MSNWANASYVIIKGNNADDCLSGTVTYVWNPSSLMYDPTLVEYLKFENKSGGVKVTNLDLNGTNYVLMLPQTLPDGITVTVCDSSDSVLSTFTMSDQMRIERGTMYLINIPATIRPRFRCYSPLSIIFNAGLRPDFPDLRSRETNESQPCLRRYSKQLANLGSPTAGYESLHFPENPEMNMNYGANKIVFLGYETIC